jgi:hypothetical protein
MVNSKFTFSLQVLPWLLEKKDPGVRYVALRDLANIPINSPELITARSEAYSEGQIGTVLKLMSPGGYWQKPGAGYNPKYFSGVWSLILLSQLGASVNDDQRIRHACEYYLNHAYTKDQSLSTNGTPSGTVDCLQGNMCAALTMLGYIDNRLTQTYEWMARSVTGDNVKYYAYKCGPDFACGANGKKPCAWGAVKVLLALGKLPQDQRTANIKKALKAGADFLLSTDPFKADYPTRTGTKPNRGWWKFGFPVFYMTDILQIAEALVSVGYGNDPRLKNTIDYIISKQDEQGRWLLEYDYSGKTWDSFGEKDKPNKWVTYRAVKILKSLN